MLVKSSKYLKVSTQTTMDMEKKEIIAEYSIIVAKEASWQQNKKKIAITIFFFSFLSVHCLSHSILRLR